MFYPRFFGPWTGLLMLLGAAIVHPTQVEARKADRNKDLSETSGGPMQVVISLDRQRMQVYRGVDLLSTSRVSTGQRGYRTPAGIFNVLQKRKWHRSNIYAGAPMPYMQRLTWSGIALHAGHVPGYPASHGCIRLPHKFARALFGKTQIGTHVVVARGEAKPVRISHAALIQPETLATQDAAYNAVGESKSQTDAALNAPAVSLTSVSANEDGANADTGAATSVEERSKEPVRVLLTRRTGRERVRDVQRLLGQVGLDAGPVDGANGRQTAAAIKAFQEALGTRPTGAFSEELLTALARAANAGPVLEGHLYVRQGFKEVFDAPIALRDAAEPLGAHLYVADFKEGETTAQWFAITAKASAPVTAETALDRFEIPGTIRERLSSMLTPGSSVIVSEHGISGETGQGTDFIVLTR